MMPLADLLRIEVRGEVLRFGVVGIAATLVHVGVLTFGVEAIGVRPTLMNGVAFLMAVLVTYFGQSIWVFRNPVFNIFRMGKFIVVALTGLLANLVIMVLAVDFFRMHYLLGVVVALIVVPTQTLLINKFWIFKKDQR